MVGTLWSGVAMVLSGYNTVFPLLSRFRKATGLVTSWIKCLSMKNTSGPSGTDRTTCASQILSNNVFFSIYLTVLFIAYCFNGYLVKRIHKCHGRCQYYICVRCKSMIGFALVHQPHMCFTGIVAALGHRLNQKFVEVHLVVNQFLNGFYHRIHGSISF